MSLGARLHQYRTARNYTLDELAERMGGLVSKQALSKYEHDRATPRPTVLIALAKALDVRAAHLMSEPRYHFEPVAYRALASLPKKEQETIESAVELELERRLTLMDKLGITPEYPFSEPLEIRDDVREVEHAAEELRHAWNLGGAPIASVVDTLESKGVHLIDVDTERKFDGLTVIATDETGKRVACGIAARLEVSQARQRMSHAHELGHLAVRVTESVDEEATARRFAGAFLYPADAVQTEFGARRSRVTVDELLAAKKRWGMSVQGVLRRLRDLQVIDETSYKWWCMFVNRAGWRTEEPGEEPREHSTWVETHAHRAAAEGLIAREALAEYIPAVSSRTAPEDIDRRALLRLPLAERRAYMRAQAEAHAAEYNAMIDQAWLDADLGEWDHEHE
ncbi:helix-turn-helix domain-containing protein [Anaerosoma tenue]|uniref:helix-turn-helix domain-containing protein n=1 Tax=Anaerosoma tenue TaxID=2933588 RepID=UPI0022609725|nr:XRE family transcriptional regulator [Anaerosoma tenue]MCK8114799.1 helix-turn-helix domain-containing protein [Anaerosoma tenue]